MMWLFNSSPNTPSHYALRKFWRERWYLVFVVRVEVVEVGGVPGGHVMQEERAREICHEKSSGSKDRQDKTVKS